MVTIDKAGRMVLPQGVRKQFGLRTGSSLDLHITSDSIILYPVETRAALTQENGLYVHEGKPDGKILDAVESARDERNRAVWGGSR
jgi:AbrB family looped-hinge helix DNA binding protein